MTTRKTLIEGLKPFFREYFRVRQGAVIYRKDYKGSRKTFFRREPFGTLSPRGYMQASLCGVRGITAHELVWLLYNDSLPDCGYHIDHIDGNKRNNGIDNLRAVPARINQHNRRTAKGFYFDTRDKVFIAKISIDWRDKYLGSFNNMLDARAAYMRAKNKYYPECWSTQ